MEFSYTCFKYCIGPFANRCWEIVPTAAIHGQTISTSTRSYDWQVVPVVVILNVS